MSELRNEEVQEREPFIVDNDMKAEWCLNKIRRIRAEQEREKEELKRQMRFYEDQMELVDREADQDAAYFESSLKAYFESRKEEGFTKTTKTGNQTSYKLPTGKLILKKQEPEYKHDDAILVPWLKQNAPQFIKIEEKASWKELKETVTVVNGGVATSEGEMVPGVTATERPDKFMVEV